MTKNNHEFNAAEEVAHREQRSRLTLKKLKVFEPGSEDTTCFDATLCFDGKPICGVRNSGQGGPHCYDAIVEQREALAAVEAWAKKQPLAYDFEHLDQLIDEIIEDELLLKQIKQLSRYKILFGVDGETLLTEDRASISARSFGAKLSKAKVAEAFRVLQNRYGDKLSFAIFRGESLIPGGVVVPPTPIPCPSQV